MPIYEYECAVCSKRFERLQKMSDPDPDVCPNCGAVAQIHKCVTAPAFRLSGTGWYETDFKKDGDKKRNLTDKSESSASSESKPEAKAETKPVEKKAETTSAAPGTKPATPTPASTS